MKYFCTKNCAIQILQYLNIKKPLIWLFTGCDFKIYKNKSHVIASMDALKIAPTNTYIVEGYSKHFDIAFEQNCRQIKNGDIPIVLVDVFYLPYRNEYQKYHASHAVIMCNIISDKVRIVDYYPPHFFKGDIPIKDFISARSSLNIKSNNPFSGFPIKNQWYYINGDLLTKSILDYIIKFNLEKLKALSYSWEDDCFLYGILAIESLISRIGLFSDNNARQSIYKEIHDALFVFKNSIYLMINYLQELNIDNLNLIIILYKLHELLNKINNNTLKAYISNNNINKDLEENLLQVNELIELMQAEL